MIPQVGKMLKAGQRRSQGEEGQGSKWAEVTSGLLSSSLFP
jgi:hypothetical protein